MNHVQWTFSHRNRCSRAHHFKSCPSFSKWIKTVLHSFSKYKLIDELWEKKIDTVIVLECESSVTGWDSLRAATHRWSMCHDALCGNQPVMSAVWFRQGYSVILTRRCNVTKLTFTASNNTRWNKTRTQNEFECLKLMEWPSAHS